MTIDLNIEDLNVSRISDLCQVMGNVNLAETLDGLGEDGWNSFLDSLNIEINDLEDLEGAVEAFVQNN